MNTPTSPSTQLAKLVADIATGDKLPTTSAEYLAVIHRAVHGGYAIGTVAGQYHTARAIVNLVTGFDSDE